jgi:hypothetical protein
LALAMRREFIATILDIEGLPTTRFEPFVPDWQPIDWGADQRDISPAAADGYARDAERIRNLPEAQMRHGRFRGSRAGGNDASR